MLPALLFLFILISVLQSFLCFPEFAALPTAAVKDQMRGIQRKVMLFQDMFGKSMELVTFQRNDLPALQANKPPRAARPQFSDIAVLRACAVHCRNFDHGVLLCETVESPINRRLSNVNSFGFETVHTLFRRHKPVAVFSRQSRISSCCFVLYLTRSAIFSPCEPLRHPRILPHGDIQNRRGSF